MMRLKFSIIVEDDTPNNFNQIVKKFKYLGNDYLKVNPKPFITIDITSKLDKGEEWTSNRTVNINRMGLFLIKTSLERLVRNFIQVKNLYYMDKGKLILNKEEAQRIMETITCGNKAIRIQPCVVPSDDENSDDVYEGCAFFINRMENFAYLTYTELCFLLHELKNINMNQLSMELITIVNQYKEEKTEEIAIDNPISEKAEIENQSSVKVVKVLPKKEIPDI